MSRFRIHARIATALIGVAASLSSWAATFPGTTNVEIQASACQRAPTIGDWYTTTTSASTVRYHDFRLEVTPAMAPATVVILDAESTAGAGTLDEVANASDPTRFELRTGDGSILLNGVTVPAGSANGTNVTFNGIAVGSYRIRGYTGSDQVPGLATGAYCDQTIGDNDDDNGFRIQVNGAAAIDGFVGALQSSFDHQNAGTITLQLYFLVGPSASDSSLALRNFDLDSGGTVTYNRPPNGAGAAVAGTASGNGVWNNGGSLNSGQDTVIADNAFAGGADAGMWGFRITNWTATNQVVFEATDATNRYALTDLPPTRAGNFTLTPATTRSTNIGTAVDHPFTVTNNFFTNDIINFTTSGTAANWTVQLFLDSNNDGIGDTLLTDLDGNGQVDTGILTPGQTRSFVLRATPNAGAFGQDVTTISAISFMDTRVGASNVTLTLAKTTSIRPTIAKAFSPSTVAQGGNSTITFTLTNRNGVALTGTSFTDAYPAGLVNATPLTVGGSCAGVTHTAVAGGGTFNVTAGTIPAATLPAGPVGSCTITVLVTATTAGAKNNTTSGTTTTQTSDGAGPASNTATLTVLTPLTLVKSSAAFSDPFNGTTNPKRIPGAFVTYTIVAGNPGSGTVDANTVFVFDAVPANTDLYVNNLGGAGSGPVAFTALTSGLTYTFTSLASATDDVSFSSDGGATYIYTPVPNANGVDPVVTHIRINPKGTFNAASSCQLQFRVRVR
jgi:uncharacterized repeat protein (TIGR01451 family)